MVFVMSVTVGTFNLNNLFSRFNFSVEVGTDVDPKKPAVEMRTSFDPSDPSTFRARSYGGSMIQAKPDGEQEQIVRRILDMDLDVLAVQEVEDIVTLQSFARTKLRGRYRHVALVEGNDPRLIDVGVLSKLPLGGVTSWRHLTHADSPEEPIFSRDLLEAEVLSADRSKRLFTLYNNHLKSHYVAWNERNKEAARAAANARRQGQAETIAKVIRARPDGGERCVVVGDMNDPPDARSLASLKDDLGFKDALTEPRESRPARNDDPPPASTAWTHRFKPSRSPAHYELYDQIWLSQDLADLQLDACIDRRTKHAGDGSDHDPAWMELNI